MRVISVRLLRECWEQHRSVEPMLRAWFREAESAVWKTSQEVLDHYLYAGILPGNRVVFNIKGNHYRLIVRDPLQHWCGLYPICRHARRIRSDRTRRPSNESKNLENRGRLRSCPRLYRNLDGCCARSRIVRRTNSIFFPC